MIRYALIIFAHCLNRIGADFGVGEVCLEILSVEAKEQGLGNWRGLVFLFSVSVGRTCSNVEV